MLYRIIQSRGDNNFQFSALPTWTAGYKITLSDLSFVRGLSCI